MNYTLCNNSDCPVRMECDRWINYIGKTRSSVMNENQMFIKRFEPNGNSCKYKINN